MAQLLVGEIERIFFSFAYHVPPQVFIRAGAQDGISHAFRIIRIHIDAVWPASLFQARTGASDGRNSAADGFEQRNAEAFYSGRIGKGGCPFVE